MFLELAEVLGYWRERVCVVGGWAVYLLVEAMALGEAEPPLRHRGSLDVDIALAWPATVEGEVRAVGDALTRAGYQRGRGFQWVRRLPEGASYRIDMMAVPPEGHPGGPIAIRGHEFAPLWHGQVALVRPWEIRVRGTTPAGRLVATSVRVPSPAALLVVKARSLGQPGRVQPERDAYDVYALVASYPGGAEALAAALAELGHGTDVGVALEILSALFVDSYEGPAMVAAMARQWGGDPRHLASQVQAAVRSLLRAAAPYSDHWSPGA